MREILPMESGLRLRSLFLGLGFLCLLLSGCGPSKEVLLAEELINQGDWDGAVAAYREAVRNDPFNEELRDKLEEVKSQAAETTQIGSIGDLGHQRDRATGLWRSHSAT